MTIRMGWICPKCQTVWSPDQKKCDTCVGQLKPGQVFVGTPHIIPTQELKPPILPNQPGQWLGTVGANEQGQYGRGPDTQFARATEIPD